MASSGTSTDTSVIVLITGANTGLGFEVAKALFARSQPYHIILGARGPLSRAEQAVLQLTSLFPSSKSTASPLSIDITSDESIENAAQTIANTPGLGHIDVLVNNAGADFGLAVQSGRLTPREGFLQTWDVNVAGTHFFTEKMMPLLLSSESEGLKPNPGPNPDDISQSGAGLGGRGKRLIFLTSGLSSISENAQGTPAHFRIPPPGWPKPALIPAFGTSPYPVLAYRASKAALNMLATEWARVLKDDNVKVFDISPGFLDTGLGKDRVTGDAPPLGKMGAASPQVGGEFLADVVEGKRDGEAWPVRVLRRDVEQPW